jgi:phage/plasmid-associated DNA primase
MKELGDGMKTENEVMYGTSELLNILFKLFVLSNNKPSISAEEVAVYNRYKQISYGSHFDRTGERTEEDPANLLFIADTTLGDKIKEEYFNEVFYLIIEYANKYYERRLPIPEQFKNDTKETQLNNDKFSLWFYENCEVDVKYKTALKEIVNNCRFDEPNVKKGLIRLG